MVAGSYPTTIDDFMYTTSNFYEDSREDAAVWATSGERLHIERWLVLFDMKKRPVGKVPVYRRSSLEFVKVGDVEKLMVALGGIVDQEQKRREKKLRRKMRKATSRSPAP